MQQIAERQTPAARVSFWDRTLIEGIPLTRETALYIALFVVALVLRLWDNGSRMLHHDESLHSVYSWYYFDGKGYVHDPMMHGPWQFTAMMLSYFLFGVSEAAARTPHAIFGSVLAILPFFLRKYMGRTGAFAAAVFIALSPSFLYFSRFAREDMFAVTWTAVVVVGVIRYLDERKPFHLYLTAAGLALFFSTKENAYIFSGILLLFLLLVSIISRRSELLDFLRRPGSLSPQGDLVVVIATLILPLFASFAIPVGRVLGQGTVGDGVLDVVLAVLAGISVIVGLRWDQRRWLWAAGIFWGIFLILVTSFFSNPGGVVTGTIDALKYWILQQGVARGDQPWYYYTILLPLYEFVVVGFGLAGFFYWIRRRNLLGLFLMFWIVLNLGLYFYTSEKMPWLNVHLALPFALLAGMTVGKLFDGVNWAEVWKRGALVYGVALTLAVLAILTLLSRDLPFGQSLSTLVAQQELFQWIGFLALLGAFVAVAVVVGRRLSGGQSLRLAGVSLLGIMMVFSIHTAWQAVYHNGETPVEMLVYVQTTPDVRKVMQQIDQLAFRSGTGKQSFKVAYDSGMSWPFEWYLRNYTSRNFYGSGLPAQDAPVVLVSFENDMEPKVRDYLGTNYVGVQYKLRWWFPEDLYRNLSLEKIRDGLADPKVRGQVWRFILYRELPQSLGSTDFVMFVRRDLANGAWAATQSGSSQITNEDVYAGKTVAVAAAQIIGSAGQGDAQFAEPRGAAVGPDGSVYVADTRNHRIQKFDASGKYLLSWGSLGDGNGQFNEPWGLTVDVDGNVYVADTWNHRVQKFDSDGKFLSTIGAADAIRIGTGPGEFYGPRDVAVDAQRNLYVTDTGNHRVQKFDSAGKFVAEYGEQGGGDGQFNEPVGVAIDGTGQIFVADTWNRRIQKFDPSFRPVAQWSVAGWDSRSVVNKPYIAVDGKGSVFATDPEHNRIIQYTGTGTVIAVWGKLGVDAGSLHLPIGLAIDEAGGVLVADSLNNRVVRYGPAR